MAEAQSKIDLAWQALGGRAQPGGADGGQVDSSRQQVAARSRSAGTTNSQVEMGKLLRCNYTGVSNLYRCDSNVGAVGASR
jgi:hypothetical protein